MDLHHRIYIALLTCLLALACVAGWFFVQNEREAILTQQEIRRDLAQFANPQTGLQAEALARVDSGFALIDKHLDVATAQAGAQLTGLRLALFGPDSPAEDLKDHIGTLGAIGAIRDAAVGVMTSGTTAAAAGIQSLQALLEKRLDLAGDFIAELLNDPKTGLIPPIISVVRIVNQVAVDHLVEKGNHASWPADITGLLRALELSMGSVEQSAKVITAAMPEFVDDAKSITRDVKREADQLTKPQGFWSSLKSWLLVIARIYAAVS